MAIIFGHTENNGDRVQVCRYGSDSELFVEVMRSDGTVVRTVYLDGDAVKALRDALVRHFPVESTPGPTSGRMERLAAMKSAIELAGQTADITQLIEVAEFLVGGE